jgi:hypothetical protein
VHLAGAFRDDHASLGSEQETELDRHLRRGHRSQPPEYGLDSGLDLIHRLLHGLPGPRDDLAGAQRCELQVARQVVV